MGVYVSLPTGVLNKEKKQSNNAHQHETSKHSLWQLLEEAGEVDDVQLGRSVSHALWEQAQEAAGKDGGYELT